MPLAARIAELRKHGVQYDEVAASHWVSRPQSRCELDALPPLPLASADASEAASAAQPPASADAGEAASAAQAGTPANSGAPPRHRQ